MIKEIIKVMLQPFKAVWSIFDNDAHKIVSKRGVEVLEKENTKIEIIHDVSNFLCYKEDFEDKRKCKKQCGTCKCFENKK